MASAEPFFSPNYFLQIRYFYMQGVLVMSYQFENSESYASNYDDDANSAKSALLEDAFRVTPKTEVAPVLVATKDESCSSNDKGCGTPEHHDDDRPQPVETPKPSTEIKTDVDNQNKNQQDQAQKQKMEQEQAMKQNQGQGQGQDQHQNAEAKAQQALDNRNDIYNKNGDNKNVSTVAGQNDSTNTNTTANRNSANNGGVSVSTGGNKYYSNARVEDLPGNECQLFAGRADGYFMGTGGALGLSYSDKLCVQAKAEKVKCDAPVALGIANKHNSEAEQSWLAVANGAQQQRIIEHGIRNTQKISDSAAQKSDECANVGVEKDETVVQEKVIVQQHQNVDTSRFATKEDLRQQNQEFGSKLDAVHKKNMQK
jgi:hypothetical protein